MAVTTINCLLTVPQLSKNLTISSVNCFRDFLPSDRLLLIPNTWGCDRAQSKSITTKTF